MTDLLQLFPITEDGDFMHRCAAVYHTARSDFLAGDGAEPWHWLFNYEAVMQLRCSAAAIQIDPQGKLIEDRPLFGLPIKTDFRDTREKPRFELVTKTLRR